jgi:hypothetical protein
VAAQQLEPIRSASVAASAQRASRHTREVKSSIHGRYASLTIWLPWPCAPLATRFGVAMKATPATIDPMREAPQWRASK